MIRTLHPARLAVLAVVGAAVGASAAGCGRIGYLEQPAPLYGERAKEEYRAGRAAQTEAERQRAEGRRQPGEVERESSNPSSGDTTTAATQPAPSDNAPLTPRDVLDPAQKLTPLSAAPLDGVPSDPRGAQPSLTPPN